MINLTERRERRIEVFKRHLLKKGSPRIHVSIIVLLTALAGFVTSFALLHVGLRPILLAEILVDGLLVAGLYKRVKHIEQRRLLKTALSRTALPAILVALFLTLAGWALQKAAPEARSIGEVWHHVMK